MKLLAVRRIYFHDNFISIIGKLQLIRCRSSHWKEFFKKISQHCQNSEKNNRKSKQKYSKTTLNEFIFNAVATEMCSGK